MKIVVAGIDRLGRSYLLSQDEMEPEVGRGRIWLADQLPIFDVHAVPAITLEPPPGGSRMGIVTIPATSSVDGGSVAQGKSIPGMDDQGFHTTRTLDYNYLIRGELMLHLDEDQARLFPGDCAVIQAARHAWQNLGVEPAQFVSVCISALPATISGISGETAEDSVQ